MKSLTIKIMEKEINAGDIIVDKITKNMYIYKDIDMDKGGLLSFNASSISILNTPTILEGTEKWRSKVMFRKASDYEEAHFISLLNRIGKCFNKETGKIEDYTNKSKFHPCEQVLVAIPFQYMLLGHFCYEKNGKYIVRFGGWIYKARPSEIIPYKGNENLKGKSYVNIYSSRDYTTDNNKD